MGCSIRPAGGWVDTAADTLVLGLMESPQQPLALRHRHVCCGHAYKKQPGAVRLPSLERFEEGGGAPLDLEYLTADNGRRLGAFGYRAGAAPWNRCLQAYRDACRRAGITSGAPHA